MSIIGEFITVAKRISKRVKLLIYKAMYVLSDQLVHLGNEKHKKHIYCEDRLAFSQKCFHVNWNLQKGKNGWPNSKFVFRKGQVLSVRCISDYS